MRLALCSLLAFTSLQGNVLSLDVLHISKVKELSLETQKVEAEASIEIDSWLNPILASYSASFKEQFGVNQENYTASIGIDQPIFKSGGIYFAIKYATFHAQYNRLGVKLKRNNIIKQTIEFAMRLQQLDLSLKQLKMDIQDAESDVSLAQEQLKVGEIDITMMNQMYIALNTLKMTLINQENLKRDYIYKISLFSDKDYQEMVLPKLTMMDQKHFIKQNISLKQSSAQALQNSYWKKVQVARYLPAVNIQARYNYTRGINQTFSESFTPYNIQSEYLNYGFSISMPIFDFNMLKTVESAQVDYLKSKIILNQMAKDEEHFYKAKMDTVRAIQVKKLLAIDSYTLFKTIYTNAKHSYEAGDSSVLDLQKSEHSLEKKKLEVEKIYFDQQIELLALYEKIHEI